MAAASIRLTGPQKKALCGLFVLHRDSRAASFSRWEIGQRSKHDCSSYPVATMRALWKNGLAEPDSEIALELVETERCRCGCDRWRITEKGKQHVGTLGAKLPPPRVYKRPECLDPEENQRRMRDDIMRMLGGEQDPTLAADWWKTGDEPPPPATNDPGRGDY